MTEPTKQELQDLRDKVAAGEIQSDYHDPRQFKALGFSEASAAHAYRGNVQSAINLLRLCLPGHAYTISHEPQSRAFAAVYDPATTDDIEPVWADTPARALLIATLDAMIGEME